MVDCFSVSVVVFLGVGVGLEGLGYVFLRYGRFLLVCLDKGVLVWFVGF